MFLDPSLLKRCLADPRFDINQLVERFQWNENSQATRNAQAIANQLFQDSASRSQLGLSQFKRPISDSGSDAADSQTILSLCRQPFNALTAFQRVLIDAKADLFIVGERHVPFADHVRVEVRSLSLYLCLSCFSLNLLVRAFANLC